MQLPVAMGTWCCHLVPNPPERGAESRAVKTLCGSIASWQPQGRTRGGGDDAAPRRRGEGAAGAEGPGGGVTGPMASLLAQTCPLIPGPALLLAPSVFLIREDSSRSELGPFGAEPGATRGLGSHGLGGSKRPWGGWAHVEAVGDAGTQLRPLGPTVFGGAETCGREPVSRRASRPWGRAGRGSVSGRRG